MARLPGRNGRLYLALTSAGTAEPVAFISSWSFSASVDKLDVTAFGDAGKVTLAGLPEQTGQFAGFYDDATTQAYTAAVDGLARKFYFYPNTLTNTQYWFGSAIFDMQIDQAVGDSIKISGNFANAAATGILKQG